MKLCVLFALIVSLVLLIAVSALTQTLEDAQQAATKQKADGYARALGGAIVNTHYAESMGVATTTAKGFTLSVSIEGTLLVVAKPTAPFNQQAKAIHDENTALAYSRSVVAEWATRLSLEPPPVDAIQDATTTGDGWECEVATVKDGLKALPRYKVGFDNAGHVTEFAYHPAGDTPVATEPRLTKDEALAIVMKESGYPSEYDTCKLTLGYGRVGAGTHREPTLFWEVWTEKAGTIYVVGYVDATTGRILGLTTPSSEPAGPPTIPAGMSLPSTTQDEPARSMTAAYALVALAVLLLVFLVVKLRKR